MASNISAKLFAAIFALAGAGLLTDAIVEVEETWDFVGKAVHAQGVVLVPVTKRQYGRYRFVDQQGQPHEFSPLEKESPSPFVRGQEVDVLYLPQQPDVASLDRYFSLWGAATIMAIIGIPFFGIGSLLLWAMMRKPASTYVNLEQTGVALASKFLHVKQHKRKTRDQAMYSIVTSWRDPDTRGNRRFHSGMLAFDPTEYINPKKPIMVYMAPDNPKVYVMDLSMFDQELA